MFLKRDRPCVGMQACNWENAAVSFGKESASLDFGDRGDRGGDRQTHLRQLGVGDRGGQHSLLLVLGDILGEPISQVW